MSAASTGPPTIPSGRVARCAALLASALLHALVLFVAAQAWIPRPPARDMLRVSLQSAAPPPPPAPAGAAAEPRPAGSVAAEPPPDTADAVDAPRPEPQVVKRPVAATPRATRSAPRPTPQATRTPRPVPPTPEAANRPPETTSAPGGAGGVPRGAPDGGAAGGAGGMPGGVPGGVPGGILGGRGDQILRADEVASVPRVVSAPRPEYPAGARARGIEGLVVVEAVVDRDGAVEGGHLRVVRSVAALDAAALDAVRRWRFQAGRDAAGRPVRVLVQIPIRFQLR